MKRFIFLIITVFSLISCNSNDDFDNYHLVTIPINEAIVPSEFEFGTTYDITIKFSFPNGCHEFYNLYYQHENTARIIAVNAAVQEDVACTLAVIEQEHTFKVHVIQREDYVFKFWKGKDSNGNDIFEEILVRVT